MTDSAAPTTDQRPQPEAIANRLQFVWGRIQALAEHCPPATRNALLEGIPEAFRAIEMEAGARVAPAGA